jgi:hypothetical protein
MRRAQSRLVRQAATFDHLLLDPRSAHAAVARDFRSS